MRTVGLKIGKKKQRRENKPAEVTGKPQQDKSPADVGKEAAKAEK